MAKDQNKPKSSSKSPAKPTAKNAPRAGSGARSEVRRQERERERQRKKLITGAIIAVALIALVVVVALIVRAPADAPIPEGALTRYDGLLQTTTTEGFPRLGDPNATVQVAEYSSFGCPHCRDFNGDGMDQMITRVRAGKIAFTYVPLSGYGGDRQWSGRGGRGTVRGRAGQVLAVPRCALRLAGRIRQSGVHQQPDSLRGQMPSGWIRGRTTAASPAADRSDILNAAKAQASALLNFHRLTPTITINGVVPLDDNQQPISRYEHDFRADRRRDCAAERAPSRRSRRPPRPPHRSTAADGAATTAEATLARDATEPATAEAIPKLIARIS